MKMEEHCLYSGTPLGSFASEPASRQGQKSIHLYKDLHCHLAFREGFVSGQEGLSRGVPLFMQSAKIVTFVQ